MNAYANFHAERLGSLVPLWVRIPPDWDFEFFHMRTVPNHLKRYRGQIKRKTTKWDLLSSDKYGKVAI